MPHKANPTRSVLVAAAARQVPGLLSTVLGSAAAEQERPAGAWHAEWQPLRGLLRVAGAAVERTGDLVGGLRFDEDAMRRNLDQLTTVTGHDRSWVGEQTEHVGVWVDRALSRHEEVARGPDR
jgi:adenylosuccinate lyase